MLKFGQITDAEVYLEDQSLVGVAAELKLPSLENGQIEHETLGSIGVLKLPKRGLAALEGSIKLSFPEPEFVKRAANPRTAVLLQVHDKIDVFGPDGLDTDKSTTRVTVLKCLFSKTSEDTNKKGDAKSFEGEFSVSYFMQRLISESVPMIEINLFSMVYRVAGEDVWPQ